MTWTTCCYCFRDHSHGDPRRHQPSSARSWFRIDLTSSILDVRCSSKSSTLTYACLLLVAGSKSVMVKPDHVRKRLSRLRSWWLGRIAFFMKRVIHTCTQAQVYWFIVCIASSEKGKLDDGVSPTGFDKVRLFPTERQWQYVYLSSIYLTW